MIEIVICPTCAIFTQHTGSPSTRDNSWGQYEPFTVVVAVFWRSSGKKQEQERVGALEAPSVNCSVSNKPINT